MIIAHELNGHRKRGGGAVLPRMAAVPVGRPSADELRARDARRCLALREDGHSIRRISHITGIPRATVHDHLKKGAP